MTGTGMRVPVVAGVAGGVGTTTVAVGLRGHDGSRMTGHRPDILVCRGTVDSVRRAADALDEAGSGPPPVLAVTLAGRAPRGALRARLELLEPDTAGLVLLPYVRGWSTLVEPLAEAARLLVEPPDRLPRPLRAYAAALREVAAAVAASGRLGGGWGSGRAAAPPDPPPPPHRAPVSAAVPPGWIPGERPGSQPGHGERPGRPQADTAPRRGVRIVVPEAVRPRGARPPGAAGPARAVGRIEQVG